MVLNNVNYGNVGFFVKHIATISLLLYNSLKINIEISIMQNRRLKLKQFRKQYVKDAKFIQRKLNPFYWNDADKINFLTSIITKC